jgi:hypothetical protein
MQSPALIILLRVVHILSGAFLIGAVATIVFWFEPTLRALGPDGQKFMTYLTVQRRFPLAITVAGLIAVTAGFVLYGVDSAGLGQAWFRSRPGMVYGFGAITAVASLLPGIFLARPAAERLGSLGKEIQAGGKPPTAEQRAELERHQAVLRSAPRWSLALLVVTVLMMAAGRYV